MARGESETFEFKSKLPDSLAEKRNVFKTVAAFASGEGGTIVFGIGDDGSLAGLDAALAAESRRFTDLLRRLVTPTPRFRQQHVHFDGKNILLVHVEPLPV